MSEKMYQPKHYVSCQNAMEELKNYMLVDGFDFVMDLEKSNGSYLIESRTGKKFLDFFTCFASLPIGMNHPKLATEEFNNYILKAARNKVSNSDIYTDVMATFVKTFFEIAVPKAFKYAFFIDGGALAIENALKVAFDWKVRKNFKKGITEEKGQKVIHFKQAFHGRTGYTMSLTNTDPNKINYYPKFDWPRITNPKMVFPLTEENVAKTIALENQAIQEIEQAFKNYPNDIAAIIIEPIQGEGGDNHFRPEFMKKLREFADNNEALLIFDEVQTGVGLSGTMWVHEQFGVTPDIMAFGKKMQICGIIVTDRIDDIPDNVFHTSSRINSTWGGHIVDMAKATRYLEVIQEENLLDNAKKIGAELLENLHNIQAKYPNVICNVRGRGLQCAFDFKSADIRKEFLNKTWEKGLMILACGDVSIRFRPPLNLTKEQLKEGINIIEAAIKEL